MIAVSDGIHQELVFLLISFALGEGLVMLYDVFRIFRKVVPHGVIWISVEDVLYWIVAALLIFGMIFQESSMFLNNLTNEMVERIKTVCDEHWLYELQMAGGKKAVDFLSLSSDKSKNLDVYASGSIAVFWVNRNLDFLENRLYTGTNVFLSI